MQSFDVILAENGFPRFDFFDFRTHGVQLRFLEDAGLQRAFITVVFVNIPAAENQVFKAGERNEILNFRNPSFCSFPKSDGPELCK